MSVSVIIPVYKVEEDIAACIASVVSQSYRELEVILVDDCGGDASMETAEQLLQGSGLVWQVVRHGQNRGLSAARNSGVGAATGDYLFFLDSDDVLLPGALEHLVALAEGHGADVATASSCDLHPDGRRSSGGYGSLSADYVSTAPLDALYRGDLYTSAWNKLINRQFYLEHGLAFAEGILYEDEPWTLELALTARCTCFSCRETYAYRLREGSITHAGGVQARAATSSLRQVQLLNALIHKYHIELNDAFNNWYLRRFIACAARIVACGEFSRRQKLALLRELFSGTHYPTARRLTEDKIILVANALAHVLPRHLAYYASASTYRLLRSLISRR